MNKCSLLNEDGRLQKKPDFMYLSPLHFLAGGYKLSLLRFKLGQGGKSHREETVAVRKHWALILFNVQNPPQPESHPHRGEKHKQDAKEVAFPFLGPGQAPLLAWRVG